MEYHTTPNKTGKCSLKLLYIHHSSETSKYQTERMNIIKQNGDKRHTSNIIHLIAYHETPAQANQMAKRQTCISAKYKHYAYTASC